MTSIRLVRSNILVTFRLVLFSLIMLGNTSCKIFQSGLITNVPPTHKWLNWNFLFSADEKNADFILSYYADTLRKIIHAADPSIKIIITATHCPCDPLLTNVDVTLVGGSGSSIPSPPPANPRHGPQGDYVVNENLSFDLSPVSPDSGHYSAPSMSFSHIPLPILSTDNRILAIIDTGLDTTEFVASFMPHLWQNSLMPTIYNVVPSNTTYSPYVLQDDSHVKHGTAVTAIALNSMENTLPKIMSLKAFDNNDQGSIYTVSCAMGCAIQNNASFINASWGYRGKEDPILKNYMQSANNKNIPVIAAAGNSPLPHTAVAICDPGINNDNLLSPATGLFYPASFAAQMDQVISVTQLNNRRPSQKFQPCYYQNYSSEYITTGVLNNNFCCAFIVPDNLGQTLEGSSFATPFVTGLLMTLTNTGVPASMKNLVDVNSQKYDSIPYTRNHNYYIFPPINR